ncbi:MAG: hypothetical protein K9H49_09665 [Bacteroidales bacterium]|nr:hypothetical protein [Bacteroidales bacterium]MCF8389922.1 hypothetical protein [Bacteroidales bacterium]
MKRMVLILLIFSGFQSGFSQEYVWWNSKHNWDGVTSWKDYINYSADYMGPNALPVPEINKGVFSDEFELEGGGFFHYSKGDKTGNSFFVLNLPVAPGIAGIKINYVPFEAYSTDTITRDLRKARKYEPEGHSFGDFYITTYIQVIKDKPNFPDVLVSLNLKTASGTNLENARHSDSPGYYFDLSLGKSFDLEKGKIKSLRPYFMGGFYSYQTYWTDHSQNDAVLFGGGVEIELNKTKFNTGIGGYYGYFNMGDRPVVYRFEIKSNRDEALNYKILFQKGIHDFGFTSVGFSAVYRFNRPEWLAE